MTSGRALLCHCEDLEDMEPVEVSLNQAHQTHDAQRTLLQNYLINSTALSATFLSLSLSVLRYGGNSVMMLFISYSFSSLSHYHFVKHLQIHGPMEGEGMGLTQSITQFGFESTKQIIPFCFLTFLSML